MDKQDPKYTIEVYEDHAIVRGLLTSHVLTMLIRLCKKEGFNYMIGIEKGFKLFRKDDS